MNSKPAPEPCLVKHNMSYEGLHIMSEYHGIFANIMLGNAGIFKLALRDRITRDV